MLLLLRKLSRYVSDTDWIAALSSSMLSMDSQSMDDSMSDVAWEMAWMQLNSSEEE